MSGGEAPEEVALAAEAGPLLDHRVVGTLDKVIEELIIEVYMSEEEAQGFLFL